MKRFVKTALIVLVGGLVLRLASVVISGTGVLEDYKPRLADQCEQLVIAPGMEDVTLDHATGQAFVSADNRRVAENLPGNGIYMFALDDPAGARKVSLDAPQDFHPHGISLWNGENDERRLFAVSHKLNGDQVIELFDVAPDGSLTHVESIADPLVASPNDLVATGPRQFYVTNDHGFGGIWKKFEDFLGLPVSNVAWFDGDRAQVVINGLAYANGINISADGRTLYVAEIIRRQIRPWARVSATEFVGGEPWPMRMAADNIELDAEGNLWTGGHSNVLAFLQHASDPSAMSPTMVSMVDPRTNDIQEILFSDGSELSGGSVAAFSHGKLIVGSVYENKLLVCDR